MLEGLTSAIQTLSIIPLPGRDTERLSLSLPWFPIVGTLLGTILYAISLIAGFDLITAYVWPEALALIIMSCGIILTRGIHLDGLADFGDAFWGAWNRQRTLEIMKDTHVGTFGVLALITVLLSKWIAITRLISTGSTIWIIAAYTVSRAIMVDLAVRLPYARKEKGTGAPFIDGVPFKYMFISILTTLAILLIIFGLTGVIPLIIGLFVSRIFGYWCNKRIGGVTGDILGAYIEITETLILLLSTLITIPI